MLPARMYAPGMSIAPTETSAGQDLAPVAGLAGRHGEWRRPSLFRREYELVAEGRTFARLRVGRGFRMTARLETHEGQWRIARRGLWRAAVAVTREGQDQPFAELERGWRGNGTLQFENGPRYLWRLTRFWVGEHQFRTESEQVVLTQRPSAIVASLRRVRVEVSPSAEGVRELPVLLGLGGYLQVVTPRHAHGAH
jgi:hypothetical protein